MNIIYGVLLFLPGIWLFDKTCLWLERKGWLYYRFVKPEKISVGTVLQELNAQIVPSNRQVIIAQKQEVIQSRKSIDRSKL